MMEWLTHFSLHAPLPPTIWADWLKEGRAYIDPGSGSYILQLVIAGLVGGAFLIKNYWANIKTFFTNLFSRSKKDE